MKKKISQDYDFCEHFYVVLITFRQSDYHQLAWSLNHHLKVDFRKMTDLMVYYPKKGESLPHNLYGWSSPNAINYFLITSSEKTNSLSSETFLLIEKRERKETVDHFIEKAASSEFIFSVEEISLDKPATTPKQKQRVEQLCNIAIDMEERFDTSQKRTQISPSKEKTTDFL